MANLSELIRQKEQQTEEWSSGRQMSATALTR